MAWKRGVAPSAMVSTSQPALTGRRTSNSSASRTGADAYGFADGGPWRRARSSAARPSRVLLDAEALTEVATPRLAWVQVALAEMPMTLAICSNVRSAA